MNSRIALFFPHLAAGGVQRSMLLLAKGFLKQGIDVDLVLGNAAGAFRNQVPSNARLIDLGARHLRVALPGMIRYLKDTLPNSVLSAQTHTNILACWAHRLSKTDVRLVISEHNDMAAVVRAPSAGRERLRPLLARLFYHWADACVAVSSGVADSLAAMTGLERTAIHVIHNPLIPPNLEELKRASCSHPWFSEGEIPLILAAGRLAPQKDYPSLLKAVASLHQHRPVRLVILGEGGERDTLESLVDKLNMRGYVELPGYVENIYAYMARAAVFVLSSAWEGFPSVLVEAMACGVPVVSTDCPSGPAEILENGRFGALVPVGDSSLLAETIMAVLENPISVESASRRANQFTMEYAVQRYMPLLLEKIP